jgi:hypothetical protein
MRLESLTSTNQLIVTIAGYESPADVRQSSNDDWLEINLSVRTPYGRGSCQVAAMTTGTAAAFADWLDALGAGPVQIQPLMLFPEPNLQLKVIAYSGEHVSLQIRFILERPGQWEMDDAPPQEGDRFYSGEMNMMLGTMALRSAAESLRAELRSLPLHESES